MCFDFVARAGRARTRGASARATVLTVLSGALLAAAPQARAARPLITDDARIVDPKACQVESWVKRNRDSTEYWAVPACNFTGNLELALGGARTHDAMGTRTTDMQVQAKTLFKPLQTNGWGIGLAVGTLRHVDVGRRDWYAYVPTSFSLRDDAVVVHTNLGFLRDGVLRRDRLTWGLGTEVRLSERSWLIAETFGQQHGKALHQLGVRHWLVPDRVQFDLTYGNHNGSGSEARWFSFGLRLLSPSFLP